MPKVRTVTIALEGEGSYVLRCDTTEHAEEALRLITDELRPWLQNEAGGDGSAYHLTRQMFDQEALDALPEFEGW